MIKVQIPTRLFKKDDWLCNVIYKKLYKRKELLTKEEKTFLDQQRQQDRESSSELQNYYIYEIDLSLNDKDKRLISILNLFGTETHLNFNYDMIKNALYDTSLKIHLTKELNKKIKFQFHSKCHRREKINTTTLTKNLNLNISFDLEDLDLGTTFSGHSLYCFYNQYKDYFSIQIKNEHNLIACLCNNTTCVLNYNNQQINFHSLKSITIISIIMTNHVENPIEYQQRIFITKPNYTKIITTVIYYMMKNKNCSC
jgi:hypothetical protein